MCWIWATKTFTLSFSTNMWIKILDKTSETMTITICSKNNHKKLGKAPLYYFIILIYMKIFLHMCGFILSYSTHYSTFLRSWFCKYDKYWSTLKKFKIKYNEKTIYKILWYLLFQYSFLLIQTNIDYNDKSISNLLYTMSVYF